MSWTAEDIPNKLSEVVKTLARYVENGFLIQHSEQRREPTVSTRAKFA
ncbi:hypothetical protein KAU55_05820 [Candidatus Bathyarchaeota archaeon]|nr:hypothetical protein [Candidatus Bathyarchaeota archaeon]